MTLHHLKLANGLWDFLSRKSILTSYKNRGYLDKKLFSRRIFIIDSIIFNEFTNSAYGYIENVYVYVSIDIEPETNKVPKLYWVSRCALAQTTNKLALSIMLQLQGNIHMYIFSYRKYHYTYMAHYFVDQISLIQSKKLVVRCNIYTLLTPLHFIVNQRTLAFIRRTYHLPNL